MSRESDIKELCKGVLEASVNVQYTNRGEYSRCPFCSCAVNLEIDDMKDFKHEDNCPYLIAKDLMTGL